MSITFKAVSHDHSQELNIDGPSIALRDLKIRIALAMGLDSGADFDLEITNAQTGHKYADDRELILKSTAVLVKRVDPKITGKKVELPTASATASAAVAAAASGGGASSFYGGDGAGEYGSGMGGADAAAGISSGGFSNLAGLSEEESMRRLINKETDEYRRGLRTARPQNAFGGAGGARDQHADRAREMTGIPSRFLEVVREKTDDASAPLVGGGFARIKQQFRNIPLGAAGKGAGMYDSSVVIPEEFKCKVCGRIANLAVRMKCCESVACDDCIQSGLTQNGMACPLCQTLQRSVDDVVPDYVLRESIQQFLDQRSGQQQGSIASQPAPSSHPVSSAQSSVGQFGYSQPSQQQQQQQQQHQQQQQQQQQSDQYQGGGQYHSRSYYRRDGQQQQMQYQSSMPVLSEPVDEPVLTESSIDIAAHEISAMSRHEFDRMADELAVEEGNYRPKWERERDRDDQFDDCVTEVRIVEQRHLRGADRASKREVSGMGARDRDRDRGRGRELSSYTRGQHGGGTDAYERGGRSASVSFVRGSDRSADRTTGMNIRAKDVFQKTTVIVRIIFKSPLGAATESVIGKIVIVETMAKNETMVVTVTVTVTVVWTTEWLVLIVMAEMGVRGDVTIVTGIVK
eukprot:ANDGO_03322.mRNA.1 hypothetical protein